MSSWHYASCSDCFINCNNKTAEIITPVKTTTTAPPTAAALYYYQYRFSNCTLYILSENDLFFSEAEKTLFATNPYAFIMSLIEKAILDEFFSS